MLLPYGRPMHERAKALTRRSVGMQKKWEKRTVLVWRLRQPSARYQENLKIFKT